jgi:hypothetical protein
VSDGTEIETQPCQVCGHHLGADHLGQQQGRAIGTSDRCSNCDACDIEERNPGTVRSGGRKPVKHDELRAEIAGVMHADWCSCDSWDGQSCEYFPEAEFAEQADGVMAIVWPLIKEARGE